MTLDKMIAADLASLGSDGRRRPVALDDVLRAIDTGARRTAPPPGALVAVRLAQVFALRVARAATGAVALALTLGLLGLLYRPGVPHYHGWPTSPDGALELIQTDAASIGLAIALALLATHEIAGRLARRWIERRMTATDPVAAGTRLVHAVDRTSIVLGIWGVTSAAILVGVATATLGCQTWERFLYAGPEVGSALVDRLREIAIAVAGTGLAALAIGLGDARRRWITALAHPAVLAIAAVLGLAALRLAIVGSVGISVNQLSAPGDLSPQAGVIGVAFTGLIAVALGLAMAGITLRRRRRELAAIALDPRDPQPAPLLVVAAGIYADRVARIAGGAVALACAAAATIAFHQPLRHGFVRTQSGVLIAPVVPTPSWWLRERATLAAVILVAILAARRLAIHVAARRFARTLAVIDAPAARSARARMMIHRVDARSVGLGAAGAAAVAALFSIASIAVGHDFWAFFQPHGPRLTLVLGHALRLMRLALPLAAFAGWAIGRACARDARGGPRPCALRVLERCRVRYVAGALALLTVVLGAMLDFGVEDVSIPLTTPPHALQLGLSLASVVSTLVFVLGETLRRRRREQARLAAALPG